MIYKVNATSIKVQMIPLTEIERNNPKAHMEDPKIYSGLDTEDGGITISCFNFFTKIYNQNSTVLTYKEK